MDDDTKEQVAVAEQRPLRDIDFLTYFELMSSGASVEHPETKELYTLDRATAENLPDWIFRTQALDLGKHSLEEVNTARAQKGILYKPYSLINPDSIPADCVLGMVLGQLIPGELPKIEILVAKSGGGAIDNKLANRIFNGVKLHEDKIKHFRIDTFLGHPERRYLQPVRQPAQT